MRNYILLFKEYGTLFPLVHVNDEAWVPLALGLVPIPFKYYTQEEASELIPKLREQTGQHVYAMIFGA